MAPKGAADGTVELRASEVLGLVATVGVAVLGTAAVALAQLEAFSAVGALVGTVVVLVVGGWAVARARPARLRWDLPALAVAGALFVGALGWFLPGSPYVLGDKDPGVYVDHAFAIERTGGATLDDPVLDHLDSAQVVQITPGARFPGLWIDPDDATRILPQFFHLWPSMQAVGIGVAGPGGAFHLTPVLAALSVVVLGLAVRAALDGTEGIVAGVATTLLLGANMLQVWQARYPTTETLSQLLFAGALLGAAVAMRTGWAPAAGAVGLLATTGFLARPDGILLFVMAAVALGMLVLTRQPAGVVRWFAAGLLLPLPYAAYNAYVEARAYTLGNDVPGLGTLGAALAAVAVVAVVGRRLWPAVARRVAARGSAAPGGLPAWARVLVIAGSGAMLLAFWYRPDLLGEEETDYNGRLIRSFDELNLQRLAYFTTRVALVAAWGGLAVTAWRRRLPARLAVICLPGVVITPVYLWTARNSPRLMWWGRRYVPLVVPTLFVLVAALAAYLVARQGRLRGWGIWGRAAQVVGVLLVSFLVLDSARQSWLLRHHREMGGSWSTLERIESVRGEQESVFLWRYPDTGIFDVSRNFGGPMFTVHGQPSALLLPEPAQADIDTYRAAFPDLPLFVVTQGTDLPGTLEPGRFELVADFVGTIDVWEETLTEVPDETFAIPLPIRVYRLVG